MASINVDYILNVFNTKQTNFNIHQPTFQLVVNKGNCDFRTIHVLKVSAKQRDTSSLKIIMQ